MAESSVERDQPITLKDALNQAVTQGDYGLVIAICTELDITGAERTQFLMKAADNRIAIEVIKKSSSAESVIVVKRALEGVTKDDPRYALYNAIGRVALGSSVEANRNLRLAETLKVALHKQSVSGAPLRNVKPK